MSSVCDYFVIASGTSTTHVRALSDNIIKKLKETGRPIRQAEGVREASWILLDFPGVVCHVFLEDTRAYYDLEELWAEAPQEKFEEKRPGKNAIRRNRKKSRVAHRARRK